MTTERDTQQEVEKIVDHKFTKGTQCLYCVKWAGSRGYNMTWEPAGALDGCRYALFKYWYSYVDPSAPCPNPDDHGRRRRSAGSVTPAQLDEFILRLRKKLAAGSTKTGSTKAGSTRAGPLQKAIKSMGRGKRVPSAKKLSASKLTAESANSDSIKPAGIGSYCHSTNLLIYAPKAIEPWIRAKGVPHPQERDPRKEIAKFARVLRNANGPPILISNDVDGEGPPEDFTYIDVSIYPPGIIESAMGDGEASIGCQCTDCSLAVIEFKCHCGAAYPDYPSCYTVDGKVQVPPGYAIYECGPNCACSGSCRNRVIQHGLQVRLEIFKTEKKGWGVRTLQPIAKNTFICEYVGEIISQEEAARRIDAFKRTSRNYLFDLDYSIHHCHENDVDNNGNDDGGNGEGKEQVGQELWDQDKTSNFLGHHSQFVVDGRRMGNISHFFNHSCDPNLVVYAAFIEHTDSALHRLAFFACRDIEVGEELCFNYTGLSCSPSTQADGDVDLADESLMRCYCGAHNCRKYIWN